MAATAVMFRPGCRGQDDDTASAEDPERAARMFRGLSTLSQHTDTEQAKEAEKAATASTRHRQTLWARPTVRVAPTCGNSTSNSKEER